MSKVMKTMDGNEAAAYASYAFTEVAGIFPITPSSPMAEKTDDWAANGKKNLFGQTVRIVEMQSEGGAAGTVHGSLAAGALTTTYTASQGLLLMIPNMYKIAGELLPGVFHVSARSLAYHALSIFGDHSDVMACRQTGFAMLASNSVQEVMDLACVAHLSAIKGRVPFLHFFDGFRTSHEIQKIECIDYDELAKIIDMDAVNDFRRRALNPEHPVLRGTAQNSDIYFQSREASNTYYEKIVDVCENYMQEINRITGRDYHLFNYYGAPDADRVIIAMGSACETIEETVDYLNKKGEKVGLVKVHLFRPFSVKHFLSVLPKTVKKIAVLDRTKESGAIGEPLYQDICSALFDVEEKPIVVGGRYGLASKDTTPAQFVAVYENLALDAPKNHFTIGIVDDVTNLSLPVGPEIDVNEGNGTISCKFWGLGADGTVGANKNSIKIIGDHTDMYAQAYFAYDSKKSGGVTQSHLRFGKSPIRSTYLVSKANFVACHKQEYVNLYDMTSDLVDGGTFLLNTVWSVDELEEKLPASMKQYIANHNINFYIIDGTEIAKNIGLGNRINTVLQASFFKLANIIPIEDAIKYMKDAITKTYSKKGDAILNMNYAAVDQGVDGAVKVEVPESWKTATTGGQKRTVAADASEYVKTVVETVNAQQGDKLPVSALMSIADGTTPVGTSAYEKRGVAIDLPEWQPDKCIQCNQCSYVCPHAAIRPFLLNEKEAAEAPESFVTVDAKGGKTFEGLKFRVQVSALDCLGCGSCADVCPAKEKALIMKPFGTQEKEASNWEYAMKLSPKANPMNTSSVKGSQFEQPLLEFSGACAGCGETPYAKLITQLYGDRMYVANATGCSSIWGGSAPTAPYTKNHEGKGPAWSNSLFEDNAEFGLGMLMAVKQQRSNLKDKLTALMQYDDLGGKAQAWIDAMDDGEASKAASAQLVEALETFQGTGEAKELADYVLKNKDQLVKKSQWLFGGDGWAYDIGYGGLDHVLASGEDLNILVFDTEVYSNTGGQASKATPAGAVAQFAASGKKIKKKDLGMMAMSYGYVYVAQVAMGADQNQFIKAVKEAEAYKGPSLIIAYAPCINHGLKGGMSGAQKEMKRAVAAGYWHMYRYNPMLKEEGKNPFILDSKDPTESFQDFIKSEVRYSSLLRTFPDIAEELFAKSEENAKERLENYKRLSAQ